MTLESVRARLCCALRTADTLAALRACVADVAADLESAAVADAMADTERVYGPPWLGDSAPSTPRASELGEEFGV